MRDWFALLRPPQWVKNGFVVAPLIFSGRFLEAEPFGRASLAFFLFCLASSSCYLLNDTIDADRDRAHPIKRFRPIAAGRIAPRAALGVSAVLALVAMVGGTALGQGFFWCVAAYLALQVAYSTTFKNVVLLDAMSIAGGFVLRVGAGVVAVDARMSVWLFACTFLLALFLALAKRRHELSLLRGGAGDHRDVLRRYHAAPLDRIIVAVAAATSVVYLMYSLSPEVAAKLGTEHLYFTTPFVVFGIFRYLFMIYRLDQGGNPTDALLGDRQLQAAVVLWVLTVATLLYW